MRLAFLGFKSLRALFAQPSEILSLWHSLFSVMEAKFSLLSTQLMCVPNRDVCTINPLEMEFYAKFETQASLACRCCPLCDHKFLLCSVVRRKFSFIYA
jgi:hypothetical protein